MLAIGWRNLRQAPLRMSAAVGGVAFSVVLITCLIGLLFGMTRNASLLVDLSRADLLVSSPNNKTFDFASPIDQRKYYLVASVPGVAAVEEFNARLSVWNLREGGRAACQIVAFELRGGLAPPLRMLEGKVSDLSNQDAVVIDQSARRMLGQPRLGERVEIRGKRATVAGICKDMRSFSTIPMVFTSLRRGDVYVGNIGEGAGRDRESMYFLVKLAPGEDAEQVRAAIAARVPDVEVHTREGLSWRTRRFWLIETGMGMAFLLVACLGLLVGGAVLSQTLLTLTHERIREFAVLKALGASMADLARVVLEQGLVCGCAGLGLGLALSWWIRSLARSAGTEVEIGMDLVAAVALATLLLSGCAALVSIARLQQVEPAAVFQA